MHEARGPADLVYEAFIGPSYVELTELGVRPADPARLEMRKTSPPLPGSPPGPAGLAKNPVTLAFGLDASFTSAGKKAK